MENSIYENLNYKLLFKLVKMIMEQLDFESLDNSIDNSLRQEVESVSKYFGVTNDDYKDDDFIYNIWKLNEDLFENNTLTLPLTRPTLKKFSFDWNVWETRWVKEQYSHTIESYSDDVSDIENIIRELRSYGYTDVWSGTLVDSEVYESDTTDDEIADGSIEELTN